MNHSFHIKVKGSYNLCIYVDRQGRQQTITQGTNVTTLVYNDAGQVLSETFNGLTVTNQLDSLNRRTNLTFSLQPSAFSLSFAYDPASRLQTVTSGGQSATYSYVANSPLVEQITFSQSGQTRMTTTKTYDNLNRLTRISSVPSASSVVSFDYAYNSANQRFAVTNADSSRWGYSYDTLGQVTSGRKYFPDGTVVPGQQFDYAFDDIGNRKTAVTGGDQWGSNRRYQNYTANALNQYTQRTVPGFVDLIGSATNRATVTVNNTPASRHADYFRVEVPANNATGAVWLTLTNLAVLQQGTNADIVATNIGHTLMVQTPESFVHDADGNLASDGHWTYTWDGENRLISMASRTETPTNSWLWLVFGYDYQGRRISKVVSNWNSTAWAKVNDQRFIYDGWNLLAILNSDLSLLTSFTWGLDLSGSMQGAGGVGGLLMVSEGSNSQITNHFAAYDGNGNVAALVKATDGTVSAQYEYAPFGELLRATGPMAKGNPFRFSTKYQDHETDLVSWGKTYLNTSTGRFVNRDSIGGIGENPYGFASSKGDTSSSPPVPDVSPCKWLGWEHAKSAGNDPKELGFMDGNEDPMPIGGPYKECACGMQGDPREAKCSVKILIAPGVDWNRRTETMTLWEHEVQHAKNFVEHFKKTVAAIGVASRWCLPKECHAIRTQYIEELISVFDDARQYKDALLHSKDYTTEEGRDQAAKLAAGFLTTYNADLATMHALEAQLKTCLDKNNMLQPSAWPQL